MRTLDEALSLDECDAAATVGYGMLDLVERERTLDALSPPQWRVMLVHLLDAEVCNGGFSQYFFNSWGDYAAETAAALHHLGASRMASLLESAMAEFGPDGPPRDRDVRATRVRELEAAGPRWLGLDRQFYDYHLDDLPAAILREVHRNREAFEGLPYG
jgi:hypothetical protein